MKDMTDDNEQICDKCEGWGFYKVDVGPGEPQMNIPCEPCEGNGVIYS